MKRKRGKDEWFPIGGVFSGQGDPEQELEKVSSLKSAVPLHPRRAGGPVGRRERGRSRYGVHGAADDAVQPTAHQPWQPASVRSPKRTLCLGYGCWRASTTGFLTAICLSLLLAWVCTEAVKTQSRELVLGRSLSEFMRKLGLANPSAAAPLVTRTRLRNQMEASI